MANMKITPINYFDEAVLAATPLMVEGMDITNAQLMARDDVARSAGLSPQVITGHFNGNGFLVDNFKMFRHFCHGGLIRLEIFNGPADFWTGTPTFDSGTVEIFQILGIESFVASPNSGLGFASNDVLAQETAYSLYFTPAFCSSFRITLTRCQYHYWEIGRIFLGKSLEAPYNPRLGMDVQWQTTDIQTKTKGATSRTRPGERWRELKVDMYYLTDAQRALWRDLTGQIQLVRDVAIDVFPGWGGRQERDFIFNAQMAQNDPFKWSGLSLNETTYLFSEV